MGKKEKEIKAQQEQQEIDILWRVLFWLGAGVLLETFVLFANRFFFSYSTSEIGMLKTVASILSALQYIGLILAAVFAAWAFFARRKNQKKGSFRFITAGFFAMLSVCCILFFRIGDASVTFLLVAIPAMAGLALVYYLYQREFFALAVISGAGILGLWLIRSSNPRYATMLYTYLALAVCLIAALTIGAYFLQKRDGTLVIGERTLQIFNKQSANYNMIFITAALVLVSFALGMIAGIAVAYYAILALVVWLFVMAVYFTSKLM